MGFERFINDLVDRATIRIERTAIRVGAIEVYDEHGQRIKRPKSHFNAPKRQPVTSSEPRIVEPKHLVTARPRLSFPRPAPVRRGRPMITPRRPRIAR